MRKLVRHDIVLRAVLGGTMIGVSCVPFIMYMTPRGPLRTIQLIALFPICIFLLQVSLAWSDQQQNLPWKALSTPGRQWGTLFFFSCVMAFAALLIVDPILRRHMPGFYPKSRTHLIVSLPWVALFQPLFLVSSTYAFAFRIWRRPLMGVAAVIVLHQIIPYLQLRQSVDLGILAGILIISGVYGMVMATAYRIYGLPGPVTLALVSQCRHAIRFF